MKFTCYRRQGIGSSESVSIACIDSSLEERKKERKKVLRKQTKKKFECCRCCCCFKTRGKEGRRREYEVEEVTSGVGFNDRHVYISRN